MTDETIFIVVEKRGAYPLSPEAFACANLAYAAIAPMIFDHLPWSLVAILIALISIAARRMNGRRFTGNVPDASTYLRDLNAE